MNLPNATINYRERAHRLIPAGAHTYSRADDQFPGNAPSFVTSAKGCYFTDEKGKEYLDYGMGLLSVTIGHAHDEINSRVKSAIDQGTCFSRPSLREGELAEKLNQLIPCAEMVKFAKNGSDVTSAAVRLARYYTGKDMVIRCRQHPFHSFYDWFISSTSKPGGIPKEVGQWVATFNYNDLDSVKLAFDENPGKIACLIMEPLAGELPLPGFLKGVKDLCEKNNALLIFDEIITGFRLDLGGAQSLYGVTPHLATFGKGLANGFPMAALCGQKDIMQNGGMGKEVFLLSCTYGGESIGLEAALATIGFMETHRVPEHMAWYGQELMNGINSLSKKYQLDHSIFIKGHPARPDIRFVVNNEYSFPLKSLFMQEMMREHIFMERIAISWSHSAEELARTLEVAEKALRTISGIPFQNLASFIEGNIAKPVFTS